MVVVGGSSGIGLACAEAARDAGASVVIAGRSQEKLDRAQALLGEGVQAVAADTTDEASVRDLFGRVEGVDHSHSRRGDGGCGSGRGQNG